MDEELRRAERENDIERAIYLRLRKGFPQIEVIRQLIRMERVASRALQMPRGVGDSLLSSYKPVTNTDILNWLKTFQDINEEDAHNAGIRRICGDFYCNSGCICFPPKPDFFGELCVQCGKVETDDNPSVGIPVMGDPMHQITVLTGFFEQCCDGIINQTATPNQMAEFLMENISSQVIDYIVEEGVMASTVISQLEPVIQSTLSEDHYDTIINNLSFFDNVFSIIRAIRNQTGT